jgi:hypothetical protein
MWAFLGIGWFIFVLGKVGFESLCQLAPCQHDAPSAAFAFEPDIRAEARDSPLIGAARMLFPQAKMIV